MFDWPGASRAPRTSLPLGIVWAWAKSKWGARAIAVGAGFWPALAAAAAARVGVRRGGRGGGVGRGNGVAISTAAGVKVGSGVRLGRNSGVGERSRSGARSSIGAGGARVGEGSGAVGVAGTISVGATGVEVVRPPGPEATTTVEAGGAALGVGFG